MISNDNGVIIINQILHKHFDVLDSTQTYLKENFQSLNAKHVLISTEEQHEGQGRGTNQWKSSPYGIYFTGTISPNSSVTLTPLEMAVLIHRYFLENHSIELRLKWPNDLFTKSYNKVGGILCQLIGQKVFVGVGLNLFLNEKEKKQMGSLTDGVFPIPPTKNKKEFCFDIYGYILNNRIKKEEIILYWEKHCLHINSEVTISDHSQMNKGLFLGINSDGSAILKDARGKIESIYTGSLTFKR